jgi:predicted nucleotidyltransferase component of viral defense system|tara:strand:+ start:1668 stop:2576 length:909 start_codon:yes stop_codon:yes gene_type:complete
MAVNKASSVRQRLLNLARERSENFDFVLKQYVIQRLLYRLSISDYQEQFLLKGAMLFLIWTGDLHRPTKDIDLLGFGKNDVDVLERDFKEICAVEADDGLAFDIDSINAAQIKEDALYQGVRVVGHALLDNAKIIFQVDIGFGDAVTPKSEIAFVPSFLDLPEPMVRIYPAYTVIAEKFQAMIALGIANSRIKDFYDIWVMASDMTFEASVLSDAVKATFERRETEINDVVLTVFGEVFINDEGKQKQWKAFLSRNALKSEMSFADLMVKLKQFLEPVYQLASSNEVIEEYWSSEEWQWKQR